MITVQCRPVLNLYLILAIYLYLKNTPTVSAITTTTKGSVIRRTEFGKFRMTHLADISKTETRNYKSSYVCKVIRDTVYLAIMSVLFIRNFVKNFEEIYRHFFHLSI